MYTALLIDGSPDPVALRIDPRDYDQSKPFITHAYPGQQQRSYQYVRTEGRVMLFRLITGGGISDEVFDFSVVNVADKHLHPEKYRDIGKGTLTGTAQAVAH